MLDVADIYSMTNSICSLRPYTGYRSIDIYYVTQLYPFFGIA